MLTKSIKNKVLLTVSVLFLITSCTFGELKPANDEINNINTDKRLVDWQRFLAKDPRSVISVVENESPDYTVERQFKKYHKNFGYISHVDEKQFQSVIEQKNIIYKTIGDRTLELDVFQPPKEQETAMPAVILLHGGGWRSGEREHLVPMAKSLAQAGFIAVTVEYRLSREALYPAGIHDTQAAIRWLKKHSKQYGIDPNRIAILGASSGAHMATLVGAVGHLPEFAGLSTYDGDISSQVQAIVNMDGIVDLESKFAHKYEDKPGKLSYLGLWLGGRFKEYPELWRHASPLHYAGKNTPPTLFLNSDAPRFHAGRDDYLTQLEKNNTYWEVHFIPDTPHTFWLFSPWFEQTHLLTVNFLNRVFSDEAKLQEKTDGTLSNLRINAGLPEERKSLWQDYLNTSNQIRATDKAYLARELNEMELDVPIKAFRQKLNQRKLYKANKDGSRPSWLTHEVLNNMISWQTPSGGWTKETDVYTRPRVLGQNFGLYEGFTPTFDNNATFTQIRILLSVYKDTPNEKIAISLHKAIGLILAAQFPNGGWPQTYPLAGNYHDWTTYNDNIITNIVNLYLDILSNKEDFAVDAELSAKIESSLALGLNNILADQRVVAPEQAGWGQQHDPFSHNTRSARAYEMPALATAETSNLLVALMRIDNPNKDLQFAIHRGINWLNKTRISDMVWWRDKENQAVTSKLIPTPGAKDIWPRMIDLNNKAVFGDRDGHMYTNVMDISIERQMGYGWYHNHPQKALDRYKDWTKKFPR